MQNQVLDTEGVASAVFLAGFPVADYPISEYSRREIEAAGKEIGKFIAMPYGGALDEGVLQAFRIAHNWRMAHAYPMMRERIRLSRLVGSDGLSVGRIKRMDSIRKKMTRGTTNLFRMQDLAGCRAVMADMDGVNAIVAQFQTDRLKRTNDYIANPKPDGYRSAHMIVQFQEDGHGRHYHNQTLEVQVRTKLQHAWATAVEAVGSMRNEDMKAGQGDARWLRLMALMSAHFAEAEGQPLGALGVLSSLERRREIKAIDGDLNAIANLATYRDFLDLTTSTTATSGFYLLEMNTENHTLKIVPRYSSIFGQDDGDGFRIDERKQSVFVGADSFESLKIAYPNYFLDVGVFLDHLREIVRSPIQGAAGFGPIAGPKSYIDSLDTSFLTSWRKKPRG